MHNAALAKYNRLDGVGRCRAFNPPALFLNSKRYAKDEWREIVELRDANLPSSGRDAPTTARLIVGGIDPKSSAASGFSKFLRLGW